MILETEHLFLRPLSEYELNGPYVSWLNDPDVCRYNSHGVSEYTRKQAELFIKDLAADKSREVFAVYLKGVTEHLGNISLQRIDYGNRSAEIAFLFGNKKYWGRGYAVEAGERLLQRAYEDLRLHRVYFGTHIENIAMQRVGEKLGFQKEGILKDAQFKNGCFNDIILYGKVR